MNIQTLLENGGVTVMPSGQISRGADDTEPAIFALLETILTGSVYPLALPSGMSSTEYLLYQPIGQEYLEADHYRIIKAETYRVSVFADTFSRVQTLSQALKFAVSDHKPTGLFAFALQNIWAEFYSGSGLYRVDLDIQVLSLPAAVQWPAVSVHALDAKAADNEQSPGLSQSVTERCAVILISPAAQMDHLRTQVSNLVIGQQPDGLSDHYAYQEGMHVQTLGPLTLWKEVYQWRRFIRS